MTNTRILLLLIPLMFLCRQSRSHNLLVVEEMKRRPLYPCRKLRTLSTDVRNFEFGLSSPTK